VAGVTTVASGLRGKKVKMKNYIRNIILGVLFMLGFLKAQAAIVLTDFTTALGEVGTAVNDALGDTVSAGLAIAGVIMGGLLLWKLFKRIAKA